MEPKPKTQEDILINIEKDLKSEKEKNLEEEIINLKKELNQLKTENNNLNQKINEHSLEIQNIKTEQNKDIINLKKEISNNQKLYESRIEEIFSEIKILKENINSNITNTIIDNSPPLSNSFLTQLSSNNENNFEKIKTLEKSKYITSVSFYRSNSIDLCMKELQYYNFEPIEGDIRKGAGDLYCILGCKYEENKPFITNIIGSVSDKEEPVIIYENEIKYTVIKDPLNNSDIHKGSGGNFLFLYYTIDPRAGKPIKNLKILTTKKILNEPNHVKYCMRNTKFNKTFESLDCNRGRDNIIRRTPQIYIIIERD